MKKRIVLMSLCFAVIFSMFGCTLESPSKPSGNSQPPQADTSEITENTDPFSTETTHPATEPPATVEPVATWTPICNEFVNMRSKPDGAVIAKVLVGAELTLEKWDGKYALVNYGGQQGYVASNYLKPMDAENYFAQRLQVVTPTDKYTYDQMWVDLDTLQYLYPQLARISVIGFSEEGKQIPVLQIGNPDAPHHVLMQGAMHGREYMTAWLLAAIADYALSQNQLTDGKVCYHIIPMANPDGVAISQTMELNEAQTAIYKSDIASGYTSSAASAYAEQWKANAQGVDLNRNFFSGWDVSLERRAPSSEKYRGEAPFSASESVALRDYTLQHNFSATISIHSHGSVIYYQYGKKQPVNDLSRDLALAVEKVTGYTLMGYDGTAGAGYKDWAMDFLEIPSITLETGTWYTPMPQDELYNTFARCKNLIPAISQWLAYTL